jgi:DNA replication protein DnaC
MMSNNEKQAVKTAAEILKDFLPVELPEQDYDCPIHGAYKGKPFKVSLFPANVDHVSTPECPKCAEDREEKERDAEAWQEKQRQLNHLKKMNIGKRYWETTFDNFSAYTDELKHHLKIAQNFANNPDGKLVMLGDNGTGKTHLAVSVLKRTGGMIFTAFEIGVKLRQSYNGDSREWEILQDLCDTEMLVIDEIGRSKGSDWDLNWLSHVINKRHENMKPLILISNRHLRIDCPNGEGGCEKDLEKFFDNDVISRITEDGMMLKFTGTDYRQHNRKEFIDQKRQEVNNA